MLNSDVKEFWYSNIFIGLALRTSLMQYHLKLAYIECEKGEDALGYLSWAARNVLEMRVWTHYVVKSEANARRFHQDQFIDGLTTIRALEKAADKMPRAKDADFIRAAAKSFRTQMDPKALEGGATDQDPFLNAGQVAKEVGLEGEYNMFNVLLSKLLHSTGYSVLVALNEELRLNIATSIFTHAAESALTIMDVISAHLKEVGLPRIE